jgi:hypothetical protein
VDVPVDVPVAVAVEGGAAIAAMLVEGAAGDAAAGLWLPHPLTNARTATESMASEPIRISCLVMSYLDNRGSKAPAKNLPGQDKPLRPLAL